MKKHRSKCEPVLKSVWVAAVTLLITWVAGVTAQTVPVTGEADVSGLVDRLDQQQAEIDVIRLDIDVLMNTAATVETDPPPDTPTPRPNTKETGLWLNVSHYRYTPVIAYDADAGAYRVTDPRFIELMSRWSGIRYLDWTGQLNREVNRTWDTRVTQAHAKASGGDGWDKTGVPLEAIIAVANATQTHVWWTAPQQADLNYMRRAGDLFARTLDPGLNVVLEIGNEVWQSNRGWRYDQLANGDFAKRMKLYARDSALKFKAFGESFPRDRLTRVIGGQLHNIGVLKSHALKYIDASEFDAISCSGYFGNKSDKGEDWRTGKNGLNESIAALQSHADLARSIGKPLLIYELNSHIENNLALFNSDPVIDGVQTMIDRAGSLGVGTIAIYAGVGNQWPPGPWPSYGTDYQPRRIVTRLGWPTAGN